MKITIERSALLRTLGHAQSIVERRNTIPILSNVLLDALGDGLVVSATDLDIQTRENTPAEIHQHGRTTVSAHTFHDIIRKMPEDAPIEIAVSDGRMSVVAGRARFSIPVLPAEDFPEINAGDMPFTFPLSAEEFARMIDDARPSMSTEETRYYLNGIYFHIHEDNRDGSRRLRVVSTDGHRLALTSTTAPEGSAAIAGVIIPRKCVSELSRVLGDVDADVQISMSSSKIRFDLGNLVFVSKVVDGTFPDYTRVIPTGNNKIVVVDADQLAEGIDRVSTIATERTRAIKVAIDKDRIQLSVTSPEHGVAVEEVSAEYSSAPMEIGFNARYFLDILQLLKGKQIEIHLADAAAPTLIRAQGDSLDSFTIMPMRV